MRTGRSRRRRSRSALARLVRDHAQQMAHLVALGVEVRAVRRVRLDLDRDALDDLESVQRDAGLLRVVREDARAAHAEVHEDLDADPVLAVIRLEAEALVRLDRVETLILQRVGAQLVHEADAATLLPQVEEHAAALIRDARERGVHLRAAVAALRTEEIAGE